MFVRVRAGEEREVKREKERREEDGQGLNGTHTGEVPDELHQSLHPHSALDPHPPLVKWYVTALDRPAKF